MSRNDRFVLSPFKFLAARIVAYLDGLPPIRGLRQVKVNALRPNGVRHYLPGTVLALKVLIHF